MKNTVVICMAAIFVAGVISNAILIVLMRQGIDTRFAALTSNVNEISVAVQTTANEVKFCVDQQTAALCRALGKVMPVRLSDELMRRLDTLEKVVISQSIVADSTGNLDKYEGELTSLTKDLPPWAEDYYRNRLTSIQWHIDALRLVKTADSPSDDNPATHSSHLLELLDAIPDGVSEAVLKRLQGTGDVFKKRQIKWGIRKAAEALEGKCSSTDARDALDEIEETAEIKTLKEKVQIKVLDDSLGSQVKTLAARLQTITGIADNRLRSVGVDQAFQEATNLRLAAEMGELSSSTHLAELESIMDTCTKELTANAHESEKAQAQKVRDYQVWALTQIKAFLTWKYESSLADVRAAFSSFKGAQTSKSWHALEEFPAAAEWLSKQTGVQIEGMVLSVEQQQALWKKIAVVNASANENADATAMGLLKGALAKGAKVVGKVAGDKAVDVIEKAVLNHDKGMASIITREAMIKYMATIDQSALDFAVSQVFNRAYGNIEFLKPDDQLHVAEQFAITEKRKIGQ